MKGICIFLFTVTLTTAFVSYDEEWNVFKDTFSKIYNTEEDVERHKIFNENKLKIVAHNKRFEEREETFKMAINQFADMFPEELNQFKGAKRKIFKMKVETKRFNTPKGDNYPASVDWRNYGCVTGVKDQGQCGASWVFALTGSVEAACYMKTGSLVSLSEQNLIDCVGGGSCSGSETSIYDGYEYCINNGGIDTEGSYPWNTNGVCNFDPNGVSCPCTGYEIVSSGSEDDLLAAVATIGPVATEIDASKMSFQLYGSGVYYESGCSNSTLDHGVLIVGYGTENSNDYWLVKNSWGTSWGEKGYIKMARNRNNNCGIATDASYPLV